MRTARPGWGSCPRRCSRPPPGLCCTSPVSPHPGTAFGRREVAALGSLPPGAGTSPEQEEGKIRCVFGREEGLEKEPIPVRAREVPSSPARGGGHGAGDSPAEPGDSPAESGDSPAESGDSPVEPGDSPAEPEDSPAEPGASPLCPGLLRARIGCA